jgi:hypothetical protein
VPETLSVLDRAIVHIACREVGNKEHPANTNRGPKVDVYQSYDDLAGVGYAWCESTGVYIRTEALRLVSGNPEALWPIRTPSCGYALAAARKAGAVSLHPHPGFGVQFDWNTLTGPGKGDWPDHHGIVVGRTYREAARLCPPEHREKLERAVERFGVPGSGQFLSVEGNTAVGNDSNGGEVMIRVRDLRQVEAFIDPELIVNLPPVKPSVQFIVGLAGTKAARPVTLKDWRELRKLAAVNPLLKDLLRFRRRTSP